jgi:hypothetical protein
MRACRWFHPFDRMETRRSCATMVNKEPDHLLEVPDVAPANDSAARILRWGGLIGGLGLCAFGIASALM